MASGAKKSQEQILREGLEQIAAADPEAWRRLHEAMASDDSELAAILAQLNDEGAKILETLKQVLADRKLD